MFLFTFLPYVIYSLAVVCSTLTTQMFPSTLAATSVHADLAPNLGYLDSLLEQDSAANLRYGVLFILALSSLGVYSIILAG